MGGIPHGTHTVGRHTREVHREAYTRVLTYKGRLEGGIYQSVTLFREARREAYTRV